MYMLSVPDNIPNPEWYDEHGLKQQRGDVHQHKFQMKNWIFNGKLKGSLKYFFEDENFGGNLWNSHPYLIWENSKFETET